MKNLFFILLLLGASMASALAQGRVNFSSAATGVNAKFYFDVWSQYGNVPLTASHPYHADLFWRPGNTTVGVNASELTNRCYFNQKFSSVGAQAGYFVGGTKAVPGWVSGPIVAQVRVWHSSIADYSQIWAYPGFSFVQSSLFVITPTTTPTAAPNLVGLGIPVTYTLSAAIPPAQYIPIISQHPQNQKVKAGTAVTFSGIAWSSFWRDVYWFFNNAPLAGGTNYFDSNSITLSNVGPANVGQYYFVASNQFGMATSSPALLQSFTTLDMAAGPTILMNGAIGYPFRLEYRDALGSGTNWTELTTITLTNTIQSYLDATFTGQQQRFYRGVQLP